MNEDTLNEDTLKDHGIQIIKTALAAVSPEKAIAANLTLNDAILTVQAQDYDLDKFKKICVIGGGKAGAAMAKAIEELLGERIDSGLVVVKDGHLADTGIVKILEAAHPVPDERSVSACNELMAYIRKNSQPDTLFIALLSGGASSLLAAPISDVSLEDKQLTTNLLLECGAAIHEINTIRKHLSEIKGGKLARLTHPAEVINLVISDVIGDELEVIGSGPLTGDSSTWASCLAVLEKYELLEKIPKPVFHKLFQGHQGFVKDTPWPREKCFKKIDGYIIASNTQALQAAATEASARGYLPYILPEPVAGDTTEAAQNHLDMIEKILAGNGPVSPPCCIISGGETTVSLGEDHGQGGRNQEFALATVERLKGLSEVVLFSIGTDGTDGPSDAAGAVVTGSSAEKAARLKLDPNLFLEHHDSYSFFDKTGNLIKTGPTMTNVMDIHLILIDALHTN